jgi:hypothetical protein
MENNNVMNDDWVDGQLASLPSIDREPNAAKALASLRARETNMRAARRRLTWAVATASVICIAVLALPGSRALAQRLWDSFLLKRAEVVRVSFENIPEGLRADVLSGGSGPEGVSSIDEAERRAGFRPILPGAGILSARPSLSVSTTIDGRLTLRRPELSKALEKAGVSGVEVPQDWEGRSIALEVGPIIVADYGELTLLQCRPITLMAPSGFDTARFLEVAFRILGADEGEARRLKDRFAANPAWFWAIPRDKQATIQEISLHSGPGIYIEDFDSHGAREGAAVIWNTPDRIYLAGGRTSRELALAVANSIP